MTIEETARAALDKIGQQDKRFVYAAIRGKVAGTNLGDNRVAVFRRVNGRVQLEIENQVTSKAPPVYELPHDLEQEASEMLDNL